MRVQSSIHQYTNASKLFTCTMQDHLFVHQGAELRKICPPRHPSCLQCFQYIAAWSWKRLRKYQGTKSRATKQHYSTSDYHGKLKIHGFCQWLCRKSSKVNSTCIEEFLFLQANPAEVALCSPILDSLQNTGNVFPSSMAELRNQRKKPLHCLTWEPYILWKWDTYALWSE